MNYIYLLFKYIHALVNQFRIRGRGRARGVFAGTNTGPSNSNTAFQKRPKEEEWDPEYTPKSKKYFLVGVILYACIFSKVLFYSGNI